MGGSGWQNASRDSAAVAVDVCLFQLMAVLGKMGVFVGLTGGSLLVELVASPGSTVTDYCH